MPRARPNRQLPQGPHGRRRQLEQHRDGRLSCAASRKRKFQERSIADECARQGVEPGPDYERSLAVVARGVKDLFRLAGLYFLRWRVETFLESLGDAAPKPRAKTIMAEVIQYLTLVFCTTLGLLMQLIVRARSRDGSFLGEPVERFSAAKLWRWALGLKRFDDPSDQGYDCGLSCVG